MAQPQPPVPESSAGHSTASPPPSGGSPLAARADLTPYAAEGAYPAAYPVQFDVTYREEYSRWLPLVKSFLTIPHWFVLMFLWLGSLLAGIGSWFAVLFTGRYPQGIFDFRVGVYRWTNRVVAYQNLLVDPYPPFSLDDDPDYPVRISVDPPPDYHIANWRPLVHWIMALPHTIAVGLVYGFAAPIVVVIAFFAILFTKSYPRGMFDFVVNASRWSSRAWVFRKYMTEKYPPFVLG